MEKLGHVFKLRPNGKTTFVHHIAEKIGLKLYEHNLTIDTNRWELVASNILDGGNSKVRKGIVLLWLEDKDGGILYLDGFNYAPANVISLVESLADWRESIYVPELNKKYKRGSKHYIIISNNPFDKIGYSGTHMINIATLRRFEPLWCYYLSIRAEVDMLMKHFDDYEWVRRLVEFADKVRTNYKEGKLTMPLTTGNLINYAKLKRDGLRDNKIVEIAVGHYLEEERPIVKKLFENVELIE